MKETNKEKRKNQKIFILIMKHTFLEFQVICYGNNYKKDL